MPYADKKAQISFCIHIYTIIVIAFRCKESEMPTDTQSFNT